jgi:Zn-dependent M28 family amino/carboxypeptidase
VEKLEVKEQQPDLLCTLPGKLDRKIIVGAHYDHVKRGEGAVDNWSGAALLPSIYEALKALHLRHTVVFAGFSAEEQGLIGSKAYVARLTPEQQSQISAMVNLDTLGLSPTKVWSNRASPLLVNSLFAVASALRLPLEPMNVETRGASADSEPFFMNDIPAITIHSVTEQTWAILHSDRDTLSQVKPKDYYDTYKLVVGYIVFLDQLLDASPAAVTSPPAS